MISVNFEDRIVIVKNSSVLVSDAIRNAMLEAREVMRDLRLKKYKIIPPVDFKLSTCGFRSHPATDSAANWATRSGANWARHSAVKWATDSAPTWATFS